MNKKDFDNSISLKLPEAPGIYLFKKGKHLLYVGKATSLRQRVRSYFSNDLIKTRGRLLVDMITQADKIDFQKTDSVLEALILEAQFIKEHQPKYNTKDKDNKSYNFVVITDEDFPRVLVVRGRNLEQNHDGEKYKYTFGPYPYGGELKEALSLIRKIFPFRDKCTPFVETRIKGARTIAGDSRFAVPRPCFNRSIGLCPGVCTGEISKKDYAIQIKNIKLFFEGKKPMLLKSLNSQMSTLAKEKEFERAGQIKKTIFALNHIQDVSLIKRDDSQIYKSSTFRIEAYDVAHMSGQNMVGSMVVIENGEFATNLYRKFTIKGFNKANDAGALEEIIKRRVKHTEWSSPNIVVLDGNEVQLKRAVEAWGETSVGILFCSVVKDDRHKAKKILFYNEEGWKDIFEKSEELTKEQIIKINAESHRFTIAFHKDRRSKSFFADF